MDFETIKQKLAETYAAVENLNIQPTKGNVDMLSVIMNNLSEAFNIIENTQRDAESAQKDAATAEKKEEE